MSHFMYLYINFVLGIIQYYMYIHACICTIHDINIVSPVNNRSVTEYYNILPCLSQLQYKN